jgi:hypothetical protein
MIVRILGEGQWDVPEGELSRLNELDDQVEAAVEAGDEPAFSAKLAALLDSVRESGSVLPDETLHDSDLILPPADATLAEVRTLLSEGGLIPD